MTAAALSGYGLLIIVAFGVRTVLHYRLTGEHGWLLASSGVGIVADSAFTLGVLASLGGPLLTVFGVIETAQPPIILAIGGLLLLYGGAAIALVAQAQLGEAWRAGVDVHASSPLVAGGLYRFSRNPFYVGVILASAGVALIVPEVTTTLGLVLVSAGSFIDAKYVEEPALRRGFGESYEQYRERTPRFLPRPWRLSG